MKKFVVFVLLFIGMKSVGQAQTLQNEFTVYLVRHAEKAWSFNPFNPPLTECGRLRAANLISLMENTDVKNIYSTDYIRTIATASPTANAYELNIEHYDHHDLEAFSQLLLDRQQDALVVGHSQTTSVLAGLLAGEKKEALDESVYDRMYQVVVVNGKGRVNVLNQKFDCDEHRK